MRSRLLWYLVGLPLAILALAKVADVSVEALGIRSPRTVLAEGVKRHIVLREHQPGSRLRFKDARSEGRYIDLSIDANGFIEPSRVHDKADVEIVFLGGSTTECLMNDSDSRFPQVVGRLFEKTGIAANCYNGGVSGNTTMHALNILLNKVVPIAPDYVILMENINDVSVLVHEKTYWNTNPTRRMVGTTAPDSVRECLTALKAAGRRLFPRLSDMMYIIKQRFGGEERNDEWRHARGRPPTVDRESARRQYRNSLITFISLARINSITPIIMTQPRRKQETVEEQVANADAAVQDELFCEFNGIVREVARSESVALIDLNALVPWDQRLFYDSIHYTDEGSRRVAQEIHTALTEIVERKARTAVLKNRLSLAEMGSLTTSVLLAPHHRVHKN